MNGYFERPQRVAATAVVLAMLAGAPCLAQTSAGASERRVIDIEAEIATMRKARQALAAEIRVLSEGVSDGRLRPIENRAAVAPVDAIAGSRAVVDLDAELKKSRRDQKALAQDLRALLSSLEDRLPDVGDPDRDALAAEVRDLQSRLAQASAVAHAASQARDQALVRLRDSELSRERQQDTLDAVGARVVEQSETLEAARRDAAAARAVRESMYQGRITALRAELSEARETNASTLQQLGSAERELADLKQRAGPTSSTMLETLRSAHAAKLEALQRDSAERSRADNIRIKQLDARREQLQVRVTDLLAELAVNERVIETAQAREKQQQSEFQALRGELSAARASNDSARVHLENQREQLQVRVTDLLAALAVSESVNKAAQVQDEQRQRELQALRVELDSARASNDTARVHLQNQREQLQTRVAGLLAELAVSQSALEAARALGEQRQSQLQALRGELSAARASNDSAGDDLAKERLQLQSLVAELRSAVAVSEDTALALERQIQEQRAQVTAAQAERAQAQRRSDELRSELGAKTAEVRDLEQQAEQLRIRFQGLERDTSHERNELLARLVSMDARREQLEGRVHELSTRGEALARSRDVLQQRVAELDADLAAARNRAAELEAKLQPASKSAAPPSTPPVPTKASAAIRSHVVQPGESLSRLAQRYLGSTRRWREIYDANRERISNPDVVEPGVELVIPR